MMPGFEGMEITAAGVNFAAFVLSIGWVFLRPAIRKARGLDPVWLPSKPVHDFISGLALPSYFAMFYALVQPGIFERLNVHMLIMAGGIAVITTLIDIWTDPEPSTQPPG